MNSKEIYKRTISALENTDGVRKILPEPRFGFTHTFETRIGLLYFKLDTVGPVLSFLGNFLENTEEAKKLVGHWKYNLHIDREQYDYFTVYVQEHLIKVK